MPNISGSIPGALAVPIQILGSVAAFFFGKYGREAIFSMNPTEVTPPSYQDNGSKMVGGLVVSFMAGAYIGENLKPFAFPPEFNNKDPNAEVYLNGIACAGIAACSFLTLYAGIRAADMKIFAQQRKTNPQIDRAWPNAVATLGVGAPLLLSSNR